MLKSLTPFTILVLTAIICLAVASAALFIVLNQPWLGVKLVADTESGFARVGQTTSNGPAKTLAPGSSLAKIGGIVLQANDLVEEPDVAESYAALGLFFERQSQLHAALLGPNVILETSGASAPHGVTPALRRPVASLPPAFWVQIVTGVFSLMVGAWVWSLRREELAARLLAGAGLGIFAAAVAAAIYSSREVALTGWLFRALSAINHFGALAFGVAMASLFLIYPRRLVPVRALWLMPVVYGAIWAMDTGWTGFSGPAEGYHLPTVILMIAILLGAFLQYKASRHDPAARAAVRWFALAVGLCAGTFVTIVLMPNLFGIQPSVSQGYAFVLFGVLFLGVAAGVARYRLFELEDWAFSILTYFGAMVLLIIFDALLISFVTLDRPAAFAVSLLAVALVYLPCRDWLARRLMLRREVDREELFGRIVDVALAMGGARATRWRQVLKDAFRPLQVSKKITDAPDTPTIVADGLSLVLPSIAGLAPLKLSYAHSGRRLFSPRDRRLAGEICAMLAHAITSREAHEKGATEERMRIARDMHDNLGAQLLSALHSETRERKDTLIRETISDLRDIVNNAAQGGKSIDELLADLKVEAAERLAAAGIGFDWQDMCEAGEIVLAPNVAHSLRSVLREVISNAIRHSGAGKVCVKVRVEDETISLDVSDDGRGLPDDRQSNGNGLHNVQVRMLALQGTFVVEDALPGLRVRVRFPLHESEVG